MARSESEWILILIYYFAAFIASANRSYVLYFLLRDHEMFSQPKHTRKVVIDPDGLVVHPGHSMDQSLLKILKDHQVKIKIHLYDSMPADSTKPVMVLLHGNSSSKKFFDDQIKHFSPAYRVIAIDLLGHGESTKISDLEAISQEDKDRL